MALLDCSDCRLYSIENGKPAERHGKQLKRPPGGRPPCEDREGNHTTACPKGHWSDPALMQDADWQAYHHYKRCQLTGHWPDDAIVIERGVALSDTEELARAEREALLATAGLTGGRPTR